MELDRLAMRISGQQVFDGPTPLRTLRSNSGGSDFGDPETQGQSRRRRSIRSGPSSNIFDVLENYRRVSMRNETGMFIETDEYGHIKETSGVSLLDILRGATFEPHEENSKIVTQQDRDAHNLEFWQYPGWGGIYSTTIEPHLLPEPKHKHILDVYRSIAIAGNDLLASVLYTTGIVATACGQLAPFALLMGCLALFPYRRIFKECGTALPLNGGVYVAMLNSSSKFTATFAASCSLISYSATAVVSAASCSSYAAGEFGDFPQIPVTIAIMAFFGLLVFFGVKDSANVAVSALFRILIPCS